MKHLAADLFDDFRPTTALADLSVSPAATTTLTTGPKTKSPERIDQFPKLTHLWAWAPTPALMEQIAKIPTLEFLVVSGVKELPAKFKLPRLHRLALIKLDKLRSLQGLQALTSLKELRVTNAKLVLDYNPIGVLKKLERLEICGEQYYDKLKSDSIDWIGNLTELREFFITFGEIKSDSGRAITRLKKLKEFFLNPRALPREEFAHLAGTMTGVKCERFAGYVELGAPCTECKTEKYVVMTGRRGGLLCRRCDEKKFTRLQASFQALVDAARNG